jgi:hypothetical protein
MKEQILKQLQNEYYQLGQKSSAYYFRGIGSEIEMENVKARMKQIDRDLDLVFEDINPYTGSKFQAA